eukprot:NODE_228_length_12276_cov_0.305337.p2 type:complete len:484 gc:universal NODE_228_length_12276_cov_0.305337:7666-9117(+)
MTIKSSKYTRILDDDDITIKASKWNQMQRIKQKLVGHEKLYRVIYLIITIYLTIQFMKYSLFSNQSIGIIVAGQLIWYLFEYKIELPIHKILPKIPNKWQDSKYYHKESSRSYHLDGIRGIASIIVYNNHAFSDQFSTENHIKKSSYGPEFRNLSVCMVVVFVCLSGYVLTQVYWNDKRSNNLYKLIFGRLCRFYPLHIVTSVLYFAACVYIGRFMDSSFTDRVSEYNVVKCFSLTHLWDKYWYHYGNKIDGIEWMHTCNIPAWSLSTELLLNLFMFVCIRYIPVFLNIFLFVVASQIGIVAIQDGSLLYEYFYHFFVAVLATKIFGWIKVSFIPFRLIFDVVCVYQLSQIKHAFEIGGVYNPLLVATHVNVTHYFVVLMILLQHSYFIGKFVGNPLFRYLGRISFSLYLIHFPLLLLLSIWHQGIQFVDNDEQHVYIMLFVIFISDLTNRFVEEPLTKNFNEKFGIYSEKLKPVLPKDKRDV